jgi:hypothetical protein
MLQSHEIRKGKRKGKTINRKGGMKEKEHWGINM